MYNVKIVGKDEVLEFEVEARYCTVDAHNNLVFQDEWGTAELVAMFPASRWIAVERKKK